MPTFQSQRIALRRLGAVAALLVLSAGVGGCGNSDHPDVAPVYGLVTYQGDPVKGATVTFRPKEGGKPATAVTDEQGRYRLSTFGDQDGAIIGEHSATVLLFESQEADSAPMSMEEAAEATKQGKPAAAKAAKSKLPARYSRPDSSGLTYSVVSGDNEFDIELKD